MHFSSCLTYIFTYLLIHFCNEIFIKYELHARHLKLEITWGNNLGWCPLVLAEPWHFLTLSLSLCLSLSHTHARTHTHYMFYHFLKHLLGSMHAAKYFIYIILLYTLSFLILMATICSRNCFPNFPIEEIQLPRGYKMTQLTGGKVRMQNKGWLIPKSMLFDPLHDNGLSVLSKHRDDSSSQRSGFR